MKNLSLVLTPCLLACGLLAGCSSGPACGDSHPYAQSGSVPRLQAPAGLTVPAPDPAYVIPPAATSTAPAAAPANGACMVIPPNVLPPAVTKTKPAIAPSAASHAPPPVAVSGPME